MLIEACDERRMLALEFDEAGDAQNYRHKINNILSSLAKHEPSKAYVRNIMRTKLQWTETGKLVVAIGPFTNSKGRPPKAIEVPGIVGDAHSRLIEAEPFNWSKFVRQLYTAVVDLEIRTIRVKLPKEGKEQLSKYLDQALAPAFSVTSMRSHIVLERQQDAEMDEIPLFQKETIS